MITSPTTVLGALNMSKLAKLLLVASACGLTACGGSAQPPIEPLPVSSAEPPQAPGEAEARPSITGEACEANGGSVVGDIGDGAIHRPDYRCVNGAKPTANISAPAGGPVAIEGSVCCPH